VLVDFWAEWCGPCLRLNPILKELADELKGRVKIAKLNVDQEQELAGAYGIMSIPTLLLFKGGEVVTSIRGFQSKTALRQKIESHL